MRKAAIGSLVLVVVLVAVALSQGVQRTDRKNMQIAAPGGSNVEFAADSIQRKDQAMELKGDVVIRTHDMILRADDVTYRERTGEIEARGTVRVKLETQN